MALVAQGMTRDDLKKQMVTQKKIEKLIADKISITDAEIAQFIKDNKIEIPAGQEAAYIEQIKTQLKNQKMSAEFKALVENLKKEAKIMYFVNY
jgi:hypothetical protein